MARRFEDFRAELCQAAGIRNRDLDNEITRLEQSLKMFQAIGSRYETASLDNFVATTAEQRKALGLAKSFAAGMANYLRHGVNLLLIGPTGAGKDHLMASLLRIAVLDHGAYAAWTAGSELAEIARLNCTDPTPGTRMAIERLSTVRLLCISDPAPVRGASTPIVAETIMRIVDRRYRHRLPTWMTANVIDRAGLNEALTTPVADRMWEGSCRIICNWPSYRATLGVKQLIERDAAEAATIAADREQLDARLAAFHEQAKAATEAKRPTPEQRAGVSAKLKAFADQLRFSSLGDIPPCDRKPRLSND